MKGEKKVSLNGKELYCFFDSGSSVNIVTRSILNQIPHSKFKKTGKKVEISLLNRSKITSDIMVELEIVYGEKRLRDDFMIIEDGLVEVIVGKTLMNRLVKKPFPVTCSIPTEPGKIIAWNRNIYNWQDKSDFRVLTRKFENKGIIEKSGSLWLNPVTFARKKDGSLRFCLDFRRVNYIVNLDEYDLPRIKTQQIIFVCSHPKV